ncbi:hypothetical protein Tco_0578445 [Tanacetum coccineum]
MANISNYGSDVISEVPHSETYLNDMENQSVHAMQDFEQTPDVDFTDNEIHSDSNIIPYSQYLQETQQANEKANKEHNNESVTAELERYKERVKTFEQRLNIDLSSREKMINSQMDDMIKEKLALKEEVDSLEQNLFKQIKENKCLLQTFIVFKSESKEKEDKYMENEIELEKKIKELDNIIFKMGQSAQTVHVLTKPQAFYDNIHKQALGYQNPFYLKKAQWNKPTLYDGRVISAKHVAMHVIDDEETLFLEEHSRSKMFEKEKDLEAIKQNISHKPIDYEKLNRLSDDFGTHFTPQQELSAEQAFWLRMSNPTSKPSNAFPIKIKSPKELPKVSLVNKSLKKLKLHLTRFDNVVKIRTTPDARTEGMFKLDLEPLAPRLLQNREAHIDYLKYTQEQADILREIVEQAKANQPLDKELDFACKHGQQIQELLVYVRDTCPNAINFSAKKVVVTPKNKVKKVRFAEPLTSSSNIKQVESSKTSNYNTLVLSSIGLKCSTSKCGSKPTGNKRNDRISQTPSRNMKNKVEAQSRKVNKKNHVVEPIRDVNVKHSLLNANFEPICGYFSGPGLHSMTPATSSSRLISNPISQQPCIPPKNDDWDHLFQPVFDEYINPPTIDISPVQEAAAPRAVV